MKLTPEYRAYVIELFAPLGPIAIKPVFGFAGLLTGGAMFGVVDGNSRIYLKTREHDRSAYEKEGSEPLLVRPRPKGELIATSYYAIPERLYDEPDELIEWARRACEAAASSSQTRKRRRRSARQPVRRRRRS
jgi:DNA transformation protein